MRFSKFILAVLMIIGMLIVPVTAMANTPVANGQPKILFQADEIKDINVLFDRAKKNITDHFQSGMKVNATAKLINSKSKAETDVETYSTTQHLTTVQEPDGTLINSYATTNLTVIPDTTYPSHQYVSNSGSKWDPTGGVLVYSTAYYDEYYPDPLHCYVQHYRTSGYWTIYDSTYQLISRSVNMDAMGTNMNGQPVQQVVPVPLSGLSFDYTTYALPYIAYTVDPVGTDDCGTVIYTKIQRGTSTWDFYVTNKILGPSNL